ncbi:hypothetical protein ACW4YW_14945 [Methylobacillus pratensis]
MDNNIIFLNVAVLAVGLFVAYGMYIRVMRMKAFFYLYSVRDSLVLLVAKGVLDEDNKLFTHYYTRVNSVLRERPKTGIQDILESLFSQYKKSPQDFSNMLARARTQSQELLASAQEQDEEVKVVIENYYYGIKFLMLSHSSLLKLFYVLSKHVVRILPSAITSWGLKKLPKSLNHGFEVVQMVDHCHR